MDRRTFSKRCAEVVTGMWGVGSLGHNWAFGSEEVPAKFPDLVAVQNAEPDVMFDKAIEAIGGITEVVKEDQVVVIKPNIAWDRPPEAGANTNPVLVRRIVEQCLQAGAKKVYVFDHTCHDPKKSYETSGLKEAAEFAGATIVFANDEKYYHVVDIPKASVLKSTKVHELITECDVLINVPVLKHHSGAGLTVAMKNLMGVVWDRGYYHKSGLHQCISDFCHYRRPDLNIVDAYRITTDNGPQRARPEDVKIRKSLLLSRDIVAVDAAAAKLFGSEPNTVRYIQLAHDSGIGSMQLEKLNIKRITL
jgi:uncharacterized protein (DUF362 family)